MFSISMNVVCMHGEEFGSLFVWSGLAGENITFPLKRKRLCVEKGDEKTIPQENAP